MKYYGELNNFLIKHNAIIAGSYPLSLYSPKEFVADDIDIYINSRNFDAFLKDLIQHTYEPKKTFEILIENYKINHILSKEYDASFFYKNNIKFKITLKMYGNGSSRKFKLPDTEEVDIIVVHDDRKLTDVVTNFDLTFCQIWFDGKNIHSTHPKHIMNMSGVLRDDYVKSFIDDKNKFIVDRIKKYKERGFKISISTGDPIMIEDLDLNSIQESKEVISDTKMSNKTEKKMEKWFVTTLVNTFMNKISDPWDKNFNEMIEKYLRYKSDSFHNKNTIFYYEMKNYRVPNDCIKEFLVLYMFANSFNTYTFLELDLNLKLFYGIDKDNEIFLYFTHVLIYILKNEPIYILKNKEKSKPYLNIANKYLKHLEKAKTSSSPPLSKILKHIKNSYNLKPTIKIKGITFNIDLFPSGYNPIEMEEAPILEHISTDKSNISIIDMIDNKKQTVTNINMEYLEFIINNLNDHWFYECESDKMNSIKINVPYIKIPSASGNIFINYEEVIDMYLKAVKGYQTFIVKKDKTIAYSASHKNVHTHENNADYVGANHCQDGSTLQVYYIFYNKDQKYKDGNSNPRIPDKTPKKKRNKSVSDPNPVIKSKSKRKLNEKVARSM